ESDKLGASGARQVLRRSATYLVPYRWTMALAVVVMLGSTACILAGPWLIGYAIDHGLKHGLSAPLDRAALAYLGVAIAAFFLSRVQILLVTRVGESFLRDLRVRVFGHIQSMSMAFFDSEQTGRLVGRMTSDIDSLEDLIQQGLVLFVTNVLLFVFTVIVLVSMAPLLFVVCLVFLPVLVVASIKFRRDSNRAYLTVRDRISQTLSSLQEGLSGVRVIQAFGREHIQVSRFSVNNNAQLDANLRAVRISAWYFPIVEGAGVATTAALLAIGGILVHDHRLQLGIVVAFVLYLANLFDPIQQMSQLFNLMQSAGAALHKLFGLLDVVSPVVEAPGAVELPRAGQVEVDGVAFSYGAESAPVLGGVSFTLAPGEHLALVGPTGAGKSTLAKLMSRLYDPTEGSIRYGGVDLRRATLDSLRHRIVVVPQEGYLFEGTIADNVRIGRQGAGDDEVRQALGAIGALNRFEALPDGLDTEVRERGSRLSAGERQLVSLARAALADPDLLVLDEATSSLDPGTEAVVEAAMKALMEGRTTVLIAHRLSSAQRADRVAVIAGGGLVELGTHDDLMAEGGHYATLFASWSGQDPSGAGALR
ncbi:MAG: ABC transporter ATP-binding protein, partial [Acidimicrobiales bacterium]